MAWQEGEDIELSRELDVYDVAFFIARGLSPHAACARVGVDIKSVRRWLAERGRYLAPGAVLAPPDPPDYLLVLDSSQVPA